MPLKTIDSTRPMEFALPGADFCFEPLPDKSWRQGPPKTSLDFIFRRLPKDEQGRAWARQKVAQETALLQAARQKDPQGQADVLMDLSLCHYLLGDLPRGRAFSDQALRLWERTGEGTMVMECLMRSAHMHQINGDVQSAIQFFERMVAYPVKLPAFSPEFRFNVLQAISELHLHQDNVAGGADAMRRGLEVAQRARLADQEKQARMVLAVCYHRLSRFQEAVDMGRPVLEAGRARGDGPLEENMRYLAAEAHKELGQYRESAEQYEELLRQARAKGAPRGLMLEVLMKAAIGWRMASDQARAEAYYREVLPLADAETSRPLGAAVRVSLAALLCDKGEAQEGLALLEQAMRGASVEMQATIWQARGEAYARLSQWEPAEKAFQKALALARQQGNAELVAGLLARLSAQSRWDEEDAAAAN